MLGFPASTEFGKRIPKQKFYENLDVSPTLRRVFDMMINTLYNGKSEDYLQIIRDLQTKDRGI